MLCSAAKTSTSVSMYDFFFFSCHFLKLFSSVIFSFLTKKEKNHFSFKWHPSAWHRQESRDWLTIRAGTQQAANHRAAPNNLQLIGRLRSSWRERRQTDRASCQARRGVCVCAGRFVSPRGWRDAAPIKGPPVVLGPVCRYAHSEFS